MAKRSATSSTPEPGEAPFTPPPVEACTEAAYRINVVIGMLDAHLDVCARRPDEDAPESTGGYELGIMRDALEGTRDLLQRAARGAAQ